MHEIDDDYFTLTKEAALRLPTLPAGLAGLGDQFRGAGRALKDQWDELGGAKLRQRGLEAQRRADDIGTDPGAYPATARRQGTYEDLAQRYGRAANRQRTARNVGAVGAGAAAVPTAYLGAQGVGSLLEGDPSVNVATDAEGNPQFDFSGYSDEAVERFNQRMGSPFGGLLDDLMNPETEEQSALRAAAREQLGDNISLMQRWQLADPQMRYLLLSLLMGGGLGAIGAMRG